MFVDFYLETMESRRQGNTLFKVERKILSSLRNSARPKKMPSWGKMNIKNEKNNNRIVKYLCKYNRLLLSF